ncbi:MAG TPA: 2-C-methyl-D-erythritol 4-phosphate cytidylyltransferase [Phycisphaerales bacterium]|nr:2-C-methyl-D-erythritol 4-phosphate cytidylyltransferase [Phycisphaerales bacterium]
MADSVAAIICAAGPGSRFGGKRKKQFMDVDGRAVFLRSVEMFCDRPQIKQVLLGIPADEQEIVSVKWGANLKFFAVQVFIGGAERFETVGKGLERVRDDISLVAVHDACRCCVTARTISDVITAAAKSGAAICASRVTATIKRVSKGVITETVDRRDLYEAQTPQVFDLELLRKAHAALDKLDRGTISDDAQLVEALGHKVSIVESDSSNIKITHKHDIAIAEAILKSRPRATPDGPVGPYIEAQW